MPILLEMALLPMLERKLIIHPTRVIILLAEVIQGVLDLIVALVAQVLLEAIVEDLVVLVDLTEEAVLRDLAAGLTEEDKTTIA